MKLNKIIAGLTMGAALALSSVTASAAPINVGGVVFDPSSAFNFLASGQLWETLVQNPGNVNDGYGQVTAVNTDTPDVFCPTCQLTFRFSGFKLVDPNPNNLLFTGGTLNFYVQDKLAPGYTPFNALNGVATSSDGTPWLSLTAHTQARLTPGLQIGTLFGRITNGAVLGSGAEAGDGTGMFDVSGGLAAAYFDTNTMSDSLGGFADFNFTSSFLPTSAAAIRGGAFPLTATGELKGIAQEVPEPASLLLVGLGLLGVAAGRKRKQA